MDIEKLITSPLGLIGMASFNGGAGASEGGGGGGFLPILYMGIGLVMMSWGMNLVRECVSALLVWLGSRFYYTAKISNPDPSFVWLLEWLSIQSGFGTRSVSVMTRSTAEKSRPSFTLLPTGTQWILYQGHIVHIIRQASAKTSREGVARDCIDITIVFGNKNTLHSLIQDAMNYSVTLNKDKTKIFTLEPHGLYWECITVQPKRVLDSVILDPSVRNHIMGDVGNFVSGKDWYVNTGVPYRRGYLFYGPPGTGKTSFILSIAGKFGYSISIMNMSKGIHDGNIHSIVQKTPADTVLVLEDIDAAFVKRQGMKNDVLTFSGLLNALDGLASSDGRILIMTTNHIERLSPALIRPGRIDVKVKFDYATTYQVTQMFNRFFGADLTWMVAPIIKAIGSQKVSTAQLQGWFIINRDDPELILKNIDEFLSQCSKEQNTSSYNDDEPEKEKTTTITNVPNNNNSTATKETGVSKENQNLVKMNGNGATAPPPASKILDEEVPIDSQDEEEEEELDQEDKDGLENHHLLQDSISTRQRRVTVVR
ncbi:AAA ATPase domain-containing protein [Cavenderia fasciculata]|uniref:AAA ATPase domain-containing protein n=1 Tax=Cavenderia fasciculata TaxID=261658 RepID=F4PGS0_CACFS|nr:AAA ATPase domain-containing protein [Cavenderia fasciculata]EGG24904.1 AAA ATPase domain-containing protein [Cavenderia fasciculata]|eukprot:XP_004362755.1 AAA ATPase domain-containing protein [Cavenderia fasciculata]